MARKIIKRTQGKYPVHIGRDDYYRYILDKLGLKSKEFTRKEFAQIILLGNTLLADWMFQTANDLVLPKNTVLGIRKFKPKDKTYRRSNIDFNKTLETGEIWYNFNDHSNGYEFKLHWFKRRCRWKNKMRYRILGIRSFNRTMARYIKSGHDYKQYE